MVRRLRGIIDRAVKTIWVDRADRVTRYDTNNITLKDSFNSFIIINNISI